MRQQAIVTVGSGRGFVLQTSAGRFVVTAGHCLPSAPPSMTFSYSEERTFPALLGPLGQKPAIAAEEIDGLTLGEITKVTNVALMERDQTWSQCTATPSGQWLWLEGLTEAEEAGMSGSPIVLNASHAIGIFVCSGSGGNGFGPQPSLAHCLPGWLLR